MAASLVRGLVLIELIGEHPRGVTELARELGVNKATVSRTLQVLVTEGFVVRRGDLFHLGPRTTRLAREHQRDAIERDGQGVTNLMSALTGWTVVISQLAGSRQMPLAVTWAPSATGIPRLATAFPLTESAGGQALLAQLDESERRSVIARATTTDDARLSDTMAAQLLQDAAAVATHGVVAFESGGIHAAMSSMALPWHHAGLTSPAALILAAARPDVAARREFAESLLRAATQDGATAETIMQAALAASEDV